MNPRTLNYQSFLIFHSSPQRSKCRVKHQLYAHNVNYHNLHQILAVISSLWTSETEGIILAMNKCSHGGMVMGAIVDGQPSHFQIRHGAVLCRTYKNFVRFLVLQTYQCYCYVLKNLLNTDSVLNYVRYNLKFCTFATTVNLLTNNISYIMCTVHRPGDDAC